MGLPSDPTAAPVLLFFSKLLKKLARTPVSLVDGFSLLPSGYTTNHTNQLNYAVIISTTIITT